jgi:hypothetical protein
LEGVGSVSSDVVSEWSDFDDRHSLCVFSQILVYVHLIVSQTNNGESLSHGRSSRPKRHNAKLCPFAIRQRIVNALANGDSVRAIVPALHVSNNTVVAIRDQDWQQVAARKTRLAAQWERVATKAVDQLNDHLDPSALPPNALVPIAGVATDKLVALSADPFVNQTHQNLHLQSVDIATQYSEFLRRLVDAERGLTSKSGDSEQCSASNPKLNTPTDSGNGNLSGDGPPAALTDQLVAKAQLTCSS